MTQIITVIIGAMIGWITTHYIYHSFGNAGMWCWVAFFMIVLVVVHLT